MLASPMNAVDQILIAWMDGQDLVPIQMRCPLLAHSGRATCADDHGTSRRRKCPAPGECPILALSGDPRRPAECPLVRVERTLTCAFALVAGPTAVPHLASTY